MLEAYPSILRKSFCWYIVTAKKATAVVYTVTDKEDRSENIAEFGVLEGDNEVVDSKVANILDHFEQRPMSYCAIGSVNTSQTRLGRLSSECWIKAQSPRFCGIPKAEGDLGIQKGLFMSRSYNWGEKKSSQTSQAIRTTKTEWSKQNTLQTPIYCASRGKEK